MSVSAELGEAIFSATRSEEAFSRPRVFLSNSDDDQDGSEDGYCSDSEADLLGKLGQKEK